MFNFQIIQTDHLARTGHLHTPHGDILTPCFMPVGTKATVKTLEPVEVASLGAQIILNNTFHLHISPGEKLIKKHGGLHKFQQWSGPILTDSGGYQVFSLRQDNKIQADSVTFHSPKDGHITTLTPKKVMKIQADLAADIIMAFDHCPPSNATRAETETAMLHTHSWLKECIKFMHSSHIKTQALFGIVQGGIFRDLREISAREVTSHHLSGYAIGGLAVGESRTKMYQVLDYTVPLLPHDKPHYLMGVGDPYDIVESVARGIDMFDCVLPTRLARTGAVFTKRGRINLNNSKFKTPLKPIDPDCSCQTCTTFSLSYIHHLLREKEILGLKLCTIHNLHFILHLMRQIRTSIQDQTFATFRRHFTKQYKPMQRKD